jgi:transcriptional regulator with XRE-family HTH domain
MPYTENQIAKTKERLWNLQKDIGLSLAQLSSLLEKEGVLISHTNLKNYEIDDEAHALYQRTKSMSLEYFVALADIYDVSVDYLLGRSKTKKAEYHQISEELCLDDEAIDLLKIIIEEDSDNPYFAKRIKLINELLLAPDMLSALGQIRDACYAHEIFRSKDDDDTIDKMLKDEQFVPYTAGICLFAW